MITCDVETQTTFAQEEENSEYDFHGFEHENSFNSYTNSLADDTIVTVEHEIKQLEIRPGKSSETISNVKEKITEFENNQFGIEKIKDGEKVNFLK